MHTPLAKTAHTLTSKRGSWLVLGGIVVLVALIFGLLSGAGEDRATESAPADSESTQAQKILDEFPEADKQSVMVVTSNEDGIRTVRRRPGRPEEARHLARRIRR